MCKIIAVYRFWAIIVPTFGVVGTWDPWGVDPSSHPAIRRNCREGLVRFRKGF